MTCRHHPCDIQTVVTATSTTSWCKECKSNVSLGPANDTPEVMIEIRAAELASLVQWWERDEFESESYGAMCFHNGGTPGDDADGGCSLYADDEHAGYLARVIATHDEEHR